MEEQKLRGHLVRIYTVTVAAVLAVVLAAAVLLFSRKADAQSRENFATLLTALCDRLRTETAVGVSELAALERDNALALYVCDNGGSLFFNSHDTPERKALLERVERMAREAGYDILTRPLTSNRRTSPVYSFIQNGRGYLSAVSILPQKSGYRAVVMVQRQQPVEIGLIALLAAGYLLAVALLALVGVRLIDRALLPAAESRRRQTEFVAAASHELRAPLAVISANASSLSGADGARAAGAMRAIETECARMSRLIGDLLLLASADAKSWEVKLLPTELDTVLLNAYESMTPLFVQKGCTLLLNLPEEPLPRVPGDAERLSQVLGILLDNALSYGVTERSRTVELRAETRGKHAVLSVIDHGPGLTGEQKAHVFDRFYRADGARRDRAHFGLGLSVASELARLQGARLSVCDTDGGGATFRIVF